MTRTSPNSVAVAAPRPARSSADRAGDSTETATHPNRKTPCRCCTGAPGTIHSTVSRFTHPRSPVTLLASLKLAKRVLLETDKRLLWKLAYNMGFKGALSVHRHKLRLKRGQVFPPFL